MSPVQSSVFNHFSASPRRVLSAFALAGLALSGIVCQAAEKPSKAPRMAIGSDAAPFNLPGVDGKMHRLEDFDESKLLVIAFTCNHCPSAQAYEERLNDLATRFSKEEVALVAISPNDDTAVRLDELGYTEYNDSLAEMKLRAEERNFGGLLDIGCYCISLSRFLFGKKPDRVTGVVELDERLGTDILSSGLMDFGRGTSIFTCSTQLCYYQRVHIVGTTGRIEIEIPFNAVPDKEMRLWLSRGDEAEETRFPLCNQYTLQGDAFARSILEDTPVPTPLSDAIENMEIIDALFASGKRSEWVSV